MCQGILKLGSSTYSVSCDSDQRLDYTDCLFRGEPVPCSLDFDVSSLPPGNHSLTMTVVNECGQRSAVSFNVEIRKLKSTISQGLYQNQFCYFHILWQCVCRFYLDQKGHTHYWFHIRSCEVFSAFYLETFATMTPTMTLLFKLLVYSIYTLVLPQLKWLDPAR